MIKYPKLKSKKKRQHHAESIMQKKDGHCWLCMHFYGDYTIHRTIHKHHVFFGQGLRKISEANGFTVYLCPKHHTDGPDAVHRNKYMNRFVQQAVQVKYEANHTRKEFMDLIGRSYR